MGRPRKADDKPRAVPRSFRLDAGMIENLAKIKELAGCDDTEAVRQGLRVYRRKLEREEER